LAALATAQIADNAKSNQKPFPGVIMETVSGFECEEFVLLLVIQILLAQNSTFSPAHFPLNLFVLIIIIV
jgi:hypothetical protein